MNCPEYFNVIEDRPVETLGRLVFGIPDDWKGLFTMRLTDDGILVGLDHRTRPEELPLAKELIRCGLEIMKLQYEEVENDV